MDLKKKLQQTCNIRSRSKDEGDLNVEYVIEDDNQNTNTKKQYGISSKYGGF